MSLPTAFTDPTEYFRAAVGFLKTYSWIYQYANTCFLKAGVFELMPSEFRNYFTEISTDELNKFPMIFSENLTTRYASINTFRRQLQTLIPVQAFSTPANAQTPIKSNVKCLRKMNQKKRHEIEILAKLITEQTQANNEVLIDFGAGLGYLSEMLYYGNAKCLILGLEADAYRVAAAQQRLETYMPQTKHRIQYQHTYINENSSAFIEESVQQLVTANQATHPPATTQMCIIGLHACADLTITSMKLFLTMPCVRKLIIMPCCYHKLAMANSEEFVNFPLSACLRRIVALPNDANRSGHTTYFNRPFLRLACQQTTARWHNQSEAEHSSHANEMFWRAVAEAIIDDNEIIAKRKCAANATPFEIPKFQQFSTVYTLKSKESKCELAWDANKHELRFAQILERYGKHGVKLAEGLTCLQTALQKLCENIVLYDRLCYLHEFAVENNLKIRANFKKLLNEQLSPRCYVLIAEKL